MIRNDLLLPSLLVAIGLVGAGYFVSKTLFNANVGINTAAVKGLAERRVVADRANWKIQYTVSGAGDADKAKLYEQSTSDQARIIALLLESGIDKTEITPGVVDFETREFRDGNQRLVEAKAILRGSIDIETNKVKELSGVRAKLNTLIAQGLEIQNNPPSYHFTQLNSIKPEMVKEATTNARIAANEFAANAKVSVGGIRQAEQGGFTVQDVGEEYGDTKSLQKDVRLVTTITFYLTE